MNPNPKIDVEFLSKFVEACSYMKKSKNWDKRLMYRMAVMLLDLLTQQALSGNPPPKKTWQQRMNK